MKTTQAFFNTLTKVILILIMLFVGVTTTAWTGPKSLPPDAAAPGTYYNHLPPILLNSVSQSKIGKLGTKGLYSTGVTNTIRAQYPSRYLNDNDGTAWPRSNLILGVDGAVGATEYCDDSGSQCKTLPQLISAGAAGPTGPAGQNVPSGVIVPFAVSSCPDGWDEYSEARGYYVVGANTSIGQTRGNRLRSEENRPTGSHTHEVIYNNKEITIPEVGNSRPGIDDKKSPVKPLMYPGLQYTTTQTVFETEYTQVPGTNAPYIQLLYCKKQ